MKIIGIMALVFLLTPFTGHSTDIENNQEGLYRVTMVRAAAGKWVELKALIEGQGEAGASTSDGRVVPYRIRHSQGDHWDFMLIQPLNNLANYFNQQTQALEGTFRSKVATLADFEEDWVVSGPSHQNINAAFIGTGMFHVEIFRARADMKGDLIDQRIRENNFLTATNIPANAVFVGKFGADWDVMTIGFYKDLAAFAADSGVTPEAEDQAARDNGFDGVGDIAPYLRSLLIGHNDTLAVAMK